MYPVLQVQSEHCCLRVGLAVPHLEPIFQLVLLDRQQCGHKSIFWMCLQLCQQRYYQLLWHQALFWQVFLGQQQLEHYFQPQSDGRHF